MSSDTTVLHPASSGDGAIRSCSGRALHAEGMRLPDKRHSSARSNDQCVGWVEAPVGAATHRFGDGLRPLRSRYSLHPSYAALIRCLLRNVAYEVRGAMATSRRLRSPRGMPRSFRSWSLRCRSTSTPMQFCSSSPAYSSSPIAAGHSHVDSCGMVPPGSL